MAALSVYLQHGFIGKSTQDKPYTARANARYIQRQSATQSVHTYLMPENYAARQRWFFDHENGLRKNGRVIDKFIIAIPRGITEEHAATVLHRFAKQLGQERCPFMFTLQGFDTNNHHAHMIFVDRDFETGKRIAETTARNSSQRIKLEWESVANTAFQELGYDVQVKVHVRQHLEAENDNEKVVEEVSEDESFDLETELEAAIEEDTEDTLEGDEDMEAIIVRARDENVSLAASHVRTIFEARQDLAYLNHCRGRVEYARQRYQDLVRQRNEAAAEREIYAVSTASLVYKAEIAAQTLEQFTDHRGKLKGFSLTIPSVSVFGFKTPEKRFASQTRLTAEAVKEENDRLQPSAQVVKSRLLEKDDAVRGLSAQATSAERDAYMAQKELERHFCGDQAVTEAEVDRTLNEADRTYRATIAKHVRDLPLEHAKEAFLAVEITEDEYEAYLIEGGHKEELEQFYENRAEYEIVEVPDEGEEEEL